MHENIGRENTSEREEEGAVESSTPPNPYESYLSKMEEQATGDFKDHELKSSGDGRWVIAKRYDEKSWQSFYMTEIIVGIGGTLIAHGDIDICVFTRFGHYDDPIQVVNWVASSGISSYLKTKAYMGFTPQSGKDLTEDFNEDVAIWELERLIRDRLDERSDEMSDEDSQEDDQISAIREAISALKNGYEEWEKIREELREGLEDAGCCDVGEMIWDIGQVPAVRLFYAKAACRKLLEILRAGEKECLLQPSSHQET